LADAFITAGMILLLFQRKKFSFGDLKQRRV
jgi:hypothetical protein